MAANVKHVGGYRAKGAMLRLMLSNDSEVLVDGPANTGKSTGVASILAGECETWPMLACLVVRLTRKSLSESFIRSFEQLVMPHGHPVVSRPINANNRHSYDWKNGARIVLGSMENAEAFFSTEWDYVVYEELIQEPRLENWLKFKRSLRHRRRPNPDIKVRFPEYLHTTKDGVREVDSMRLREDFDNGLFEKYDGMMPDRVTPIWKHQMIGITNPGDENSWIIKRAEAGLMKRFQSKHEDNPTFGHEERAQLESLEGVLRDRLYLGLWKSAEGAIWPAWTREKHMMPGPTKRVGTDDVALDAEELVEWWRRFGIVRFVVGVDWGHTDAGCMTVFGVDEDGRMYRVYEIYHTGWTVGGDSDQESTEDDWLKAAKRIYAQWRPEVFVCDSARADCIAMMRKAKLPTAAVSKSPINGKGFVAARLDLVRDRLKVRTDGKPRICWVTDALEARDPNLEREYKPCCTEEEIPSYVWKRDRITSRIIDGVPEERQNDHGCDACTYAVLYVEGHVHFERAVPEETVRIARLKVEEPFQFGELVHAGPEMEDTALQLRDRFAMEWVDGQEDVGAGGGWRMWCDLYTDRSWKMLRPYQNLTYVIGCSASPVGESTMVVSCRETREQVAEYSAIDMPTEEFARAAARAGHWWGGTTEFAYLVWRADTGYGLAFGEYLTKTLAYPFWYRDRDESRTDELRGKKFGWYGTPAKMVAMIERFRVAISGHDDKTGNTWVPKSGRLLDQLNGYAWFGSGKIGPAELEGAAAATMLNHSDLVVPAMLSSFGLGHVGTAKPKLRKAPKGSKAWLQQEKERKKRERLDKSRWR